MYISAALEQGRGAGEGEAAGGRHGDGAREHRARHEHVRWASCGAEDRWVLRDTGQRALTKVYVANARHPSGAPVGSIAGREPDRWVPESKLSRRRRAILSALPQDP